MAASTKSSHRKKTEREILLAMHRTARSHLTASRKTASALKSSVTRVNKKLSGQGKKLTGMSRKLSGIQRTANNIHRNTSFINTSIDNFHRTYTHHAALTQAELGNLLTELKSTKSTMHGVRSDLARIDRRFLTMAADMAALRAHFMTHGASGLTPSDIKELKDIIGEGHKQQRDRWEEDDRISGIQSRLSDNAEKSADSKADYQWWQQAIGSRKQMFQGNMQNARQQNHLAGALVGLEFGLINLFIVEPIRIGQWAKYRLNKSAHAREKASIRRDIASARTRAPAPVPTP